METTAVIGNLMVAISKLTGRFLFTGKGHLLY
jgi:hypothetical protein